MSFDIFFQSGRFSGKPVVGTNPFSGEARADVSPDPLSTAEVNAVQQVLKRVEAHGPDDYGCYVVELEDGGVAEVFADKLESVCIMVKMWGLTPGVTQFLFELLKAGNWLMLPVMEDAIAIAASPDSVKGVPDGFPKVVVCDSANEVGLLLSKGVNEWLKYRDQVVRGE